MNEILTAIIPAIIACLLALGSYIVGHINNKKLKEKINTLDEFLASDDTEYFVTCPHCGHEICLNKLKIVARKGDQDNVDK